MIATHGLTHIALSVANPQRSLNFYAQVFGVREYFRSAETIQVPSPGEHRVIEFEKHPADAGRIGGIVHFGFRLKRAEDIDAAVAAVQSAGGRIRSQVEFFPRYPYALVSDPDG